MHMVILRGLPGSGKSTLAHKYVAEGYKRLNKDDLRAMLDYSAWSSEKEVFVERCQELILHVALFDNHDIVIDNVHANDRVVRALCLLAKRRGYACDVVVLKTPIEECIARDAKRANPVGELVIRRFANSNRVFQDVYGTSKRTRTCSARSGANEVHSSRSR